MASYAIGCKELRVGPKGTGGTMGDTLTAMKVFKNTVKLTEGEPTVTPFFSENSRFPDVVSTENGGVNLNWEVHDVSKANLAAYMGGTADATTETWSSSSEHFSTELSVEIDDTHDETWQFAAVHTTGKIDWSADRTNIMRIVVTGMVLKPEGASTPPIKKIPTT